jgi:hypothetical protein
MTGVYAGAQPSHGAVNSQLSIPVHYHASGSDSLDASFGKPELGSSAFIGYGHAFNRWYAGIEAELDAGLTRWAHDRTNSGDGGRDFAVARKGSRSLDIRAGYVWPNGTLLFMRVGRGQASFNTTYTRGSNAVDRTDTLHSQRLGMGVEVPINKASFLRLDYLVADYGNLPQFSVGKPGTADIVHIAIKEGQFRVGFGVRF